MRNHFLRAAAGAAVPIEFVDGVSGADQADNDFVTPPLSVTVDDFVFIFSAGKQADANQLTANSTATISRANTTNTSNSGTYFVEGDGGNDALFDSTTGSSFDHGFWSVTSSGVLYFEDTNERESFGFMASLAGIDVSNFDVDVDEVELNEFSSNQTLSLSGIDSNDLLFYVEGTQNGSGYPTLPSGFTNAGMDQTRPVGIGGNAEDWYIRVGYLESPSSSFSHTILTPPIGVHKGAIVLRFYNL